ncbi:hypothetical protein D9M72_518670 [compost metagenome]
MELGGSGIELVGTRRNFGDFVLYHGERHEPLDGIVGRSLQQLQRLGQGCGAGARFRTAVRTAVALELGCPCGKPACAALHAGRSLA